MECTLCSVKYRSDADKQQHLQGRSHLKRVKSSSCTASHHVPSPSCPSTSSPHLIPSSSSARVSAPTTTLSSSLPSIPSQVARTVAAPDSIDHSSTKTIETLTQRERALQGNQDQTALESDETSKRSETQDNNIDRETAETVAKLIAAGAIPQEHYHNLPYPPTAALDTIRSRGPRSAAPFHCSVCARNFHLAQDLSTHLKSRSHTELQDAYARGSRACAQYAFTLTQCALSLYSQRLPQPNEVPPGEQEYYDYMTQLLGPGSNFEQATKKLRESIALGSQRKENIRFFNALSEGFAGLTRFIEDDQMDQLDAEQETFFKHAATLDDDNDDDENDDGEDDEDEEEEFEDGPSGGYFDGNDYFD